MFVSKFIARAIVASLMFLIATISVTAAQVTTPALRGLHWRSIGPLRGGRALAVSGVEGVPDVYYFGAAAGGVWKTENAGITWSPLFEKQSVSSIGSIAVAPSDPNVIYVGTGEACIRGDSSYGDGVYKSLNGGKTWTNIGLKDTRHIGRVIVDPHSPDLVFVAALGHTYGANAERGVFRSQDGGKNWEKVLYVDDQTGAIDVAFDPNNSHILFAALWQVRRTPWSLVSGGPGSGLYKSSDGGSSWKRLQGSGLPEGPMGRIGVAVSAADSNRVYALIEAKDGGLFRSDDAGEHWTRTDGDYDLRGRPWYYTHVFADPKSSDTVYVLTFGAYRSTDAGKSFHMIRTPHGDYHDLWIDPNNSKRLIIANDGGATISTDGGKSWSAEDNQPTAQFYHIAADNRFNYHLYGAQQDSGTVAIASRSDEGAIGREDWYSVAGGESGYICPSPTDPDIVYAGSNYAVITRFDKHSGQAQVVSPWPKNLLNDPASKAKYRLGWTPPIQISPHDPNVMYVGAQMVLKTTDGGMSWNAISPDLTLNDKSKQQSSGGPITQDNTGTEYFDQISTLAESPVQKDLIWVGTDDGLVQLTRDGGKTWGNITPKQMPQWGFVSLIDASAHEPGTAYIAVDRHRLDDFKPYIFKTSDYGKSWEQINEGLPGNAYIHAVREDPVQKGLLFAGSETGIFVSFNDGKGWQPLQLNLPTVPVYDLLVHNNDLAIATHGRAFWVLDDITPLRQLDKAESTPDFYLDRPAVAYRTHAGGRFGSSVSAFVGENPPSGAILDYYLKAAPKQPLVIEIFDAKGKLVHKFTSAAAKSEKESPNRGSHLPVEVGSNRFVWDLRYPGAMSISGGDADFEVFGADGPLVVPGTYQVKLTVDGHSQSTPLEVKLDPRVRASQSDLEKQLELALQVRDELTAAREAVMQMRDLHSQIQALRKRLAGDANAREVLSSSEELDKKVLSVEEAAAGWKVEPNRYALNYPQALDDDLQMLNYYLDQADGLPNQPSYEVFAEIAQQLNASLERWRNLKSSDLLSFNELMRKQNIMALSIKTIGVKSEEVSASQ